MTLKEVFKSALELDREDMTRLVDSLTAVIEVAVALPVPEPQPQPVKTRVKRVKKQKPADKVQAAFGNMSVSDTQY